MLASCSFPNHNFSTLKSREFCILNLRNYLAKLWGAIPKNDLPVDDITEPHGILRKIGGLYVLCYPEKHDMMLNGLRAAFLRISASDGSVPIVLTYRGCILIKLAGFAACAIPCISGGETGMKHSNTDEAIRLAMQGRWEEAVAINKSIIELAPNDVKAHNRLGKALTEMGHYAQAKEAYERVVELEPNNNIARRNLQRLSYLKEGDLVPKEVRNIDSRFFIEETNKAKMTSLYKVAPRETLVKMSAGDYAHLQIQDHKLVVVSNSGEYLGEIEPRIGQRLIYLIEGGNKYQVMIIGLRDDTVRVIIREAFRHPSQVGHTSFPTRATEELKPYLKDTLVRHDIDEDTSDEPDEPGDLEGEEEPLWQDDVPTEDEIDTSIEEEDMGKADKKSPKKSPKRSPSPSSE